MLLNLGSPTSMSTSCKVTGEVQTTIVTTVTVTATATASRKKQAPFDKYIPPDIRKISTSHIKAPSDAGQKEVGGTGGTGPPVNTPCSTTLSTICSTHTAYPHNTSCVVKPYSYSSMEKDVMKEHSKEIGNIVKYAVITVLVIIIIILGLIWGYRRKRRKRAESAEKIGTDVEGGSGSKIWRVLGRRNSQKGKARGLGSAPGPSTSVAPEMAERNQRLSIILPPSSRRSHPHRVSNTNSLNRTLSVASSLTVPPYSRASSSTRSNSTRTAHSLDSDITNDTVVRAKRDYQNTVSRLAVENMHNDHAVVADGFHCAPPNPFDGDDLGVAGAGGMGGNNVGVGGLGEVDGQGNRRPAVTPDIRVADAINPFEDPVMEDEDIFVADGFRPQGGSIAHRPPPPPPRPLLSPALENPFEDGVGDYVDVGVGIGDGFQGYVPGQMMCRLSGSVSGASNSRRLSMRGGDADANRSRRLSTDGLSLSSSSTARQSLSSNETLQGDPDWGPTG